MAGRKSAAQWFLTLPQSTITKYDLTCILDQFCPDFVIGQEAHKDGGVHFHAIFKTEAACTFDALRDHIVGWLPEAAAIDLRTVKARRSCVRYCCKEDYDPARKGTFFKKDLPFAVECMDWVKENQVYSLIHPFILAHWTSYKFCQQLHTEYWESHSVPAEPASGLRQVELLGDTFKIGDKLFRNIAWVESVFDWCQDSFVPNRRHKMKQLYMYGTPNCGKTTLINSLIDMDHVYWAGRDKWWFENFRVHEHYAVFLDEFNWDTFSCKKELLKLLAGEPFIANVKGVSPRKINVNIPVIMLTNDEPPTDAAFLVRVRVVYTDDLCYTPGMEED